MKRAAVFELLPPKIRAYYALEGYELTCQKDDWRHILYNSRSFLCLGMAAKTTVSVDDAGPIATSFPIFERLMGDLGATLERLDG